MNFSVLCLSGTVLYLINTFLGNNLKMGRNSMVSSGQGSRFLQNTLFLGLNLRGRRMMPPKFRRPKKKNFESKRPGTFPKILLIKLLKNHRLFISDE